MRKRETGIGGTDVSAIVGINPYKNSHDVFLDKTGRSPRTPMNEPMYWGVSLEENVAKRYQEEHPDVDVVNGLGVMEHPKYPWWLASPDRSVLKGGKRIKGLEVKTASIFKKKEWGEPGTDQIPRHYLLQALWYMPILNVNEMDVPVLFGGQEYAEYTVKRDNELLGIVFEKAEKFWKDHILKDEPPPIDGSDACGDSLLDKFPVADDQIIEPGDGLVGFGGRYNEIQLQIKGLEEEKEKLKNIFKKEIGENKGMQCPEFRVLWGNWNRRAKTDWESVQGHFIRTLEKSGLSLEESQKSVKDIITMNTTKKPFRQFRFTWKKEQE
jgi:putative phage-type endonuclease